MGGCEKIHSLDRRAVGWRLVILAFHCSQVLVFGLFAFKQRHAGAVA